MSDSIAALFQRLTQGVYVVGVAHGEVRNAFTAAWVMQVSFNRLLLTLSIDPHHSSYRLLKEGRAFSVNVLKKGQLDLAEHFGRPARADKLAGTSGRRTARASLCCVRHWPGSSAARRRTPCRRPHAGAGKSDRWQAVGFRSRAHVLSRNWCDGRRLCAVSRRVRRLRACTEEALPWTEECSDTHGGVLDCNWNGGLSTRLGAIVAAGIIDGHLTCVMGR